MKLATWNLALPVAPRRREAMRVHTDREKADVWVLTETHDGFTPGHEFCVSSVDRRDGLHPAGHRWVSIWSSHPLEKLETSDPFRTVAARLTPSSGARFIVYGVMLPWVGSSWQGQPAKGGLGFRAAVAHQGADWLRLRQTYPEDEFFLLGDFNQDMVTPGYYGTLANRAALEAELRRAGLHAITAGAGDPVRRDSPRCASLDHICARSDSKWSAEPAVRWPNAEVPERSLSDHFGVSVELRQQAVLAP